MGNKLFQPKSKKTVPKYIDIRLKRNLIDINRKINKKELFSRYLLKMSERELEQVETPDEKFENKVVLCRLTKVYDGDTATIVFYDGEKLECFKFRVYGYDSPEMRVPISWGDKRRKRAKQEAVRAKHALINYIMGKKLVADILGKDKYGRLIGKIYAFPFDIIYDLNEIENYSLTKYMIENGFGVPYKRGNKSSKK